MHFCFKVLQDISSDEFSISPSPTSPSSPLGGLSGSRTDKLQQPLSSSLQGSNEPRLQPMLNHKRVNSDGSFGFEGVLLSDDLMNFPPIGSSTSLASGSSSGCGSGPGDVTNPVRCEARNELEQDSENVSQTDVNLRESKGPKRSSATCQIGSWVDADLPRMKMNSQPDSGALSKRTESSFDAEEERRSGTFLKSNHFAACQDNAINHSSPVTVPRREALKTVGSVNSLGSWQVIDSAEHLKSLDPSNTKSSQTEATSIGSCNVALAINMSTLRCQRLDAVSRLFHTAYYAALSDEMGEDWQKLGASGGGGGALSSLFNSLVGQVGFKSSSRGDKQDRVRSGSAV
ncbi:hypothetical protein ElyMa_002954600 [Elysia marginata]|uniref:Uncharacterized protein n=1 Tax=Elysia marginata TaxID=1093978 RepID=A0AAV4I947_9GAST|nr:hypothetical protein ElyMa_002954600 [Elysia marginata]